MRTFKHIVLMAIFVCLCVSLTAGSIDYITNQSVPFLRTLSRNAATDETDAIVYNPAGTVRMSDGLYLSFNYQGFTKDYKIKAKTPGWGVETEYSSTIPTPILPSFFALYKQDNWALFGAFTAPAGGGSLEYDNGLFSMPLLETGRQQTLLATQGNPHASYHFASMINGYFEGTSIYFGYTVGGAYQVNDKLSFSLAGRYLTASKEYDGMGQFHLVNGAIGEVVKDSLGVSYVITSELKATKEASGLGGIFGMNFRNDKLNIGVRYETQTTLKFKTKTDKNDWEMLSSSVPMLKSFKDGFIEYRDLPAQLSVGLSYDFTEAFKLNTGMNYFFINNVVKNSSPVAESVETYANYNDGYEIQLGGEFKANEQWLFSAGYNYVVIGGNKDTYNDFEYQLDAHFIGLGFRWSPTVDWKINFAVAKPFYQSSKGSGNYAEAEYSKDVNILGLSVEYKLF